MKKGRGKAKGNIFERKVARLLDVWWRVPRGTFWRSKISGGSNEPGDITPRVLTVKDKALYWPFVIECKHYKDIKLIQLLKANDLKDRGLINSWWAQLTDDYYRKNTPKSDLYRLLFFKGNNTPVLVAFCPQDFKHNKAFIKKTLLIQDILLYKSVLFSPIAICAWENFSVEITKDIFINSKYNND